MKSAYGMIAFASLGLPSLAFAQTPNPSPPIADEHRLTPEQIEAVLAEAAARNKAAATRQAPVEPAPAQDDDAQPAPQVHGEVGFGIGTDGYREAYGTAIYPISDDGVAAISIDLVNLGRRPFPR